MIHKGEIMENISQEKSIFLDKLSSFAQKLGTFITQNGEWTVKGFIDVFKNVYTISNDSKVISKILELHLFPYFLNFAEDNNYKIELASRQNWYPDLTFISKANPDIKFAVDLKSTYRNEKYPDFCNGFTLGSHGEYFINRESHKNIQYPYNQYKGHFCLGIIYSRAEIDKITETEKYSLQQLHEIPSVINNFIFFAQEKWKIASDKGGSGNTANIGSIQKVEDIINGNGVFSKAGEEYFDDYWKNFGKIQINGKNGKSKVLSSFEEYLKYRNLPLSLNNPKASKGKKNNNE